MRESIIIIITVVLSVFIQGWIILYFTYFKKKGEYLAMKEEIDEITKTTERIKHDLSIITQKQIGLNNEIRNAIIQYNDIVSQCVDGTLLSLFTKSTVDIAKDYFSETFAKHSLAQSRLFLFVQDVEIERMSSQIGSHIFAIAQFNMTNMAAYEKMVKEGASQEIQIQFVQNYSTELVKIATPVQIIRKELNKKFKRYFE